MDRIIAKTKIDVNKNLFLKDPISSDIGCSIVKEGAKLIDELGLENFTFKKLSQKIDVSEAAIYRYFDNKHMLLLYLTGWYWAWLEINFVYATANLESADAKLDVGLDLMVNGPIFKKNEFLDPVCLYKIIINESFKVYYTKSVDEEHKKGFFTDVYKFGDRISEVISEISPSYQFPVTLAFTVMESSILQAFNVQHLPEMTDNVLNVQRRKEFFRQLILNTVHNAHS